MAQIENKKETNPTNKQMTFTKKNYLWVIIGVVVLAIGMILMIGGGSSDPDVFNPAMFNARRLVVAPILILVGFAIEIYAIMLKNK